MPTVSLNGQEIFYTENVVDSPAPAVIFVHGAGGRSQSWPYAWSQNSFVRSPAKPRWLTDFSLYMLDLPGHGRSHPPHRTSIDAYAQDIIKFASVLGLKRYIVAGHSMGAAIAQTVALQKPDGLAGLILLGAGATMPVSDMILDGLQTNFEQTVQMIVKFSWSKGVSAGYTAVSTQHMLTTNPTVVHADFSACNQFDVRQRLSEIDVPTLIIGGENDKMMPMKNGQFLAETIPNATLVEIKNAGHFMMTEKTTQVTQHIVSYINKHHNFS